MAPWFDRVNWSDNKMGCTLKCYIELCLSKATSLSSWCHIYILIICFSKLQKKNVDNINDNEYTNLSTGYRTIFIDLYKGHFKSPTFWEGNQTETEKMATDLLLDHKNSIYFKLFV